MDAMRTSRRNFIRVSSLLGGGLIVGFDTLDPDADNSAQAAGANSNAAGEQKNFAPNAWIKISASGQISTVLDRVEMGQGTMTSHAMMVAEELEVSVQSLKIEFAGADSVYKNNVIGTQLTGASSSVVSSWKPLRLAAATAREMLIAAAAKTWNVAPTECKAVDGQVVHQSSGRKLAYGALASMAATMPVPDVTLKEAKDFRVLGTSVPRLDARSKVDGTALFGIDTVIPDLRIAVVVRCPVRGGKVKSFQAKEALASPGVEHVVAIENGIAVVAKSYWQARKAAALVTVEWDEGPLATLSSAGMRARYLEKAKGDAGKSVRSDGDIKEGFKTAVKTIEATYEAPFLAHATMEPQNCTALVKEDSCDIWVPTQGPAGAQDVASRVTGLPHSKIRIHQTLLGGGFGRRIAQDYVAEAVAISQITRTAVKVVWSREDDTKNDFYRPAMLSTLRAGIDATGEVTGWEHRVVSQSIMSQLGPEFVGAMAPQWLPHGIKNLLGRTAGKLFQGTLADSSSVEGASTFAYALKNVEVTWVYDDPGVPIGFWRSVGHSQNAFAVEGFVDELAHLAGKDPYEFRRGMLTKAPRNLAVLDVAVQKAGWKSPAPKGVFRGLAQHESFGSFCAQVIEVSVAGGQIKVLRVVCAIDCGFVLNPDIVKAQMESSIVFGLSAALKGKITFAKGQVEQSNFHDYEVLRMNEMPKIEVHIVGSSQTPAGVGEPGVPPVAPALANAVFAATGKRLRALPLTLA